MGCNTLIHQFSEKFWGTFLKQGGYFPKKFWEKFGKLWRRADQVQQVVFADFGVTAFEILMTWIHSIQFLA